MKHVASFFAEVVLLAIIEQVNINEYNIQYHIIG